jgi:hypothetical protein
MRGGIAGIWRAAPQSAYQTELGVVSQQGCHGPPFAVGFLQVFEILLQGIVVELNEKFRGHRRVIAANVLDQLTFVVHERTTFSGRENSGDQYVAIGRLAAET